MADLLSSTNRIEIPFVSVTIGSYTFGVKLKQDSDGIYKTNYPDYVKSLSIVKVNGQVNTYKLVIMYPITQDSDPNFFEKLFSSISSENITEVANEKLVSGQSIARKITFSYGDLAMPSYIYKEEQAVIKSVTKDVNIKNATIQYTIDAISSSALAMSGTSTFKAPSEKVKVSSLIKDLLYSTDYVDYGLLDLFYGMRDLEFSKFVDGEDIKVQILDKTNISVFEYLKYLVSCMQTKDGNFYALIICDDTNNNTSSQEFNGPYFKVKQIKTIENQVDYSTAYDVTIGFPTAQIIKNFSINDNQLYSLYYKWQGSLNSNTYSERLDPVTGNWEKVEALPISSGGEEYMTTPDAKNWWNNVTKYPIKATLSLKGLLRPAILMDAVRIRVIFFGKQFIDSGIYLITKQQDEITESGYTTTLSLTRVSTVSYENVVV